MASSALRKKAEPTLADVVEHIVELHDCLHNVDQKVDGLTAVVGASSERIARVEGFQSGIAARLRVPADGVKISLWERCRRPVVLFSAVFGAITAFVTAYPGLRGLLLALDVYLSHGR